jgi:hypothetical protein
MGFAAWTRIDWVSLLQSAGIVASFLFTAHTVREDSRQRKIENLFSLNAGHREIWSKLYEYPHLGEVLDPLAIPSSAGEELFVNFLILQLAASFRARKLGMYFNEDGLRLDVREFFSLPVPNAVWQTAKVYQEKDFVDFVQSCLE